MLPCQASMVCRRLAADALRYGDTINEFAQGLAKKLGDGRPTGGCMLCYQQQFGFHTRSGGGGMNSKKRISIAVAVPAAKCKVQHDICDSATAPYVCMHVQYVYQ